MDAAELNDGSTVPKSSVSRFERMDDARRPLQAAAKLADDIDDLRRKMAETFLKEASFTADPVILISRQLDVKINEYMKQREIGRKKAW